MTIHYSQWYIPSHNNIPEWFKLAVVDITGKKNIDNLVKLLWGRDIRDSETLNNILCFSPSEHTLPLASTTEWDNKIEIILSRLFKAWQQGEKVVIIGDSSLHGIMTTCLFMEGLQPYFMEENRLTYHLFSSQEEIDTFKDKANLIIFSHGNFNLVNSDFVNSLLTSDIDIISLLGFPNYDNINDKLFALTDEDISFTPSIIKAYQLLSSFTNKFEIEETKFKKNKIDNLLNLVTLTCLACEIKIKGESRFLLKKGVNLFYTNNDTRINLLSNICFNNNDSPTDYLHGVGERLKIFYTLEPNLLIEFLLTNNNRERLLLSEQIKKTYAIFLQFKQTILKEIEKQLTAVDLLNQSLIILYHSQWNSPFLQFIPRLISEKYHKPTILLSRDTNFMLAGYGYTIEDINLWELLVSQRDLLTNLVPKEEVIELSLSLENIELLRDNLNQQIRSKYSHCFYHRQIIDFVITLNQFNKELAQELFLLKPFTVDNPRPKFLIKNVWFKDMKDNYNKDIGNNVITLKICDETLINGKNGIWKNHQKKEIKSQGRYNTIVELDYDYQNKRYYLIIVEVNNINEKDNILSNKYPPLIIDKRQDSVDFINNNQGVITINKCPLTGEDLRDKSWEAIKENEDLILAYRQEEELKIEEKWSHFLTIIKQGINKHHNITITEILMILNISENSLDIILNSLNKIGISYEKQDDNLKFIREEATFLPENYLFFKNLFEEVIYQENLQKTYFYQVPIKTSENIIF